MIQVDIVTCPEWGARTPRGGFDALSFVNKSEEIIFHHTAGHHAEIDGIAGETYDEAVAYARAIQDYHMDANGWIDSGHNFLVCRNGLILQGRWRTVAAIQGSLEPGQRMVTSAHCPGHNDDIGIEHEHRGLEEMTAAQRESSALLQAWIADQYGRSTPLPVSPHSKYYATSCPANLVDDIAAIRQRATSILQGWNL